MMNSDLHRSRALADETLEAVAGGTSAKALHHIGEWDMACVDYECKLCGMRGTRFADHQTGCAVRNFPYSSSDSMATQLGKELNFCWSCKYAFHSSDPSSHSDLCCGHDG